MSGRYVSGVRVAVALVAMLAGTSSVAAQGRNAPGIRTLSVSVPGPGPAPTVRTSPRLPNAAIAGAITGIGIELVKARGRSNTGNGPRYTPRPGSVSVATPKPRPRPGHTPDQTAGDNGDGKPRPKPRPRPVIVAVPDNPPACRNGRVRIAGACVCPKGTVDRNGRCGTVVVTVPDTPKPCRPGKVRIEGECVCPTGTVAQGGRCRPVVVIGPPIVLPEPSRPRPDAVVVAPPLPLQPTPPVTLAPVSPPATPPAPPRSPPVARPSPPPTPPPGTTDLAEREPNEVLVTVASSAPTALEDGIAQAFALQILERTPVQILDARLVRLFIPDGRMISEVTAALAADPRVSLAQANYVYRRLADPAPVPAALKATTTSDIQYALAKAGVSDAHGLARGRGTRIAVIDSGVDRSHPDFNGAAIEEIDATGDGAIGTPTDAATARPVDDHGTAIAGIIAARGTLTGVAPETRVLSARIFRKSSPTAQPTATTMGLLKGFDWAVANGAQVINMSLAGPEDPLVARAIKLAADRRIIAVAAAGNGGPAAKPAYPAAYAEVIAVTAIDADDRLYEKANRGAYVAVAAPGVDVLVPARDRAHRFDSGTSLAAAHVSGIVGLMLELDPSLTVEAAREALSRSALDLGPTGTDEAFGAGRVDAAATLRRITAGPVTTARK